MGKTKQGSQNSTQTSKSYQSSLANTQEGIVKRRDEIFESYYLPEFQDFYKSLSPDSDAGKAQMGLTANQIDASFKSAQDQTNQSLAQRNITDTGVGMALTAANNRARSSALAQAYANQMANSNAQKGTALANFATMLPAPTQAAPVLSESSGTSSGVQYTNLSSGLLI